jgi:hypothetical protein
LAFLAISAYSPVSAADTVNYDTAWTYVYDGGKHGDGTSINDNLFDVKGFPNGTNYFVGTTTDSANWTYILFEKLDGSGKNLLKKLLVKAGVGRSIIIGKNNDLIIGAGRGLSPFILRADTLGNMKWTTWYYDSVQNQRLLQGNGTVNCVRETKRGTFICAGGGLLH